MAGNDKCACQGGSMTPAAWDRAVLLVCAAVALLWAMGAIK